LSVMAKDEMKFTKFINETTLSRVMKHFTDKERTVLVITAFRGINTYKENVKLNRQLASKIKSAGFGYVFVDGRWTEKGVDGRTEKGVDADGQEDSIFVNGTDSDKLKSLAVKWMKEYKQDSILFKPAGGIDSYLIYQDGRSDEKLGVMSIKSIEKIKNKLSKNSVDGAGYTKLRGRGDRTFIFEGFREELSWLSKLGVVNEI